MTETGAAVTCWIHHGYERSCSKWTQEADMQVGVSWKGWRVAVLGGCVVT
jgi:hypothetical protein